MAILMTLYVVSILGALLLTWTEGVLAGAEFDFWRTLGLLLCLVWPLVFLLMCLIVWWRRWVEEHNGPVDKVRNDSAIRSLHDGDFDVPTWSRNKTST